MENSLTLSGFYLAQLPDCIKITIKAYIEYENQMGKLKNLSDMFGVEIKNEEQAKKLLAGNHGK